MSTKRLSTMLLAVLLSVLRCAHADLPSIHLPPGFSIDYYSKKVPGARQMALGEQGV